MACDQPCASSGSTSVETEEIVEWFEIEEEERYETEEEISEFEEQSVEDASEEATGTFGETLGGQMASDMEKMLVERHCWICHL